MQVTKKTIAVLMPSHPHVRNKVHFSRMNIKRYFGLKVILKQIEIEFNIKPEIITYEKINDFDIILFSCLSTDDFYSLVYTVEKKYKQTRQNIWVAGGPAISNINPFVNYFDYVVLGRGESIINDLIKSIDNDQVYKHESVVYTKEYKQENVYKTNYASELYPHKIDNVKETMYGCKYNCTYCRYRTATLPPTKRDFDKGTTMPGNEETFWDLDIKNGSFHTTSLDGLSESVRYAVLKPIKNVSIVKGFEKWAGQTKIINLKIYFIVGYPYNYEFDLTEIKEVFNEVSKVIGKTKVFISLHFTPFGADPHTPMQWENVTVNIDYRKIISDLKNSSNYLHESDNLRVIFLKTTMQPYAIFKRMLFNRMELSDLELVKYIASSSAQISHKTTTEQKFNDIKTKYQIDRFTNEREIGTFLPSQNILVWKGLDQMVKEGLRTREKLRNINVIKNSVIV